MTQKSYLGVDKLYYAIVTQDDAGAYAADTPVALAPLANIGIEPATNVKTQYFDNKPADTLTAEGETKIPLEIQGLPLALKALLLGKVYDATQGRMFDSGGVAPYVALGFRGEKTDGNHHYWWFLKGRFSPPKEELATKTDTPDPKTTQLDFTAVKTIHEFAQTGELTDSSAKVEGDDAEDNFDGDTWFDAVQLPIGGVVPAFTLTPSPADGASGVALAANVTLTFSNPLAGGAEDGIILVRSDTQAAIACARTIDTARKVVTLDPSSNLTTGETYLVIVPGATDIFGQALADTVVNFDTV